MALLALWETSERSDNDSAPTFYPIVSYRDAQAALDWLQQAFGFEKLFATPGADGAIAHAELSFGSGVLMLNTASAAGAQAEDWRDATESVYVAVEDPDAHCARARAAGAESRGARGDGLRLARVLGASLEGRHWHFGTYRPFPSGHELATAKDVLRSAQAAAEGALHQPVPVARRVLAGEGERPHRARQLLGVERRGAGPSRNAPFAQGSSCQVVSSGSAGSSRSSGRSAETAPSHVAGPAHTRSRSSAPGVPAKEARKGAGLPSGPSCV